ncbi:hypothetical protein EK21DRAFT_114102 [Setomelanomma holmii]|uniref:Rhodopsin domain-containing protein n=1 Tax=Setomelanomma holmii TaxID=210430 RepID=A0A9P4LIN0_9PLEO|nr:hypothetical protein EK21DRAFT_114102 [Setomelanomma holmii]
MPSELVAKGLASQRACVGTATALTSLSIVIVSLRIYTRVFIVRNLGKDDCAMLFALLLTISYLIAIFVLKDNGLGFSGKLLKPSQMLNQVQITLSIEIVYYFLINAIKISILFFYLRIAAAKRLEILSKGTIYFLATFCGICVICCLTQCIPLHKMWDFTGLVAGKCINTTVLFYTTSSLNIAIDIWILVLPIPTLLKVQHPKREKAALVGIFSLGAFSCIASIVRLHSIKIYTESKDPFFDSVPINLWSMVEVNVGIYCASIPSLKALFSSSQRQRSRSGAYHYHSRERSGKTGTSGDFAGTLVQHESYGLKHVESGAIAPEPEPAHARPQQTWLASDSEVSQERIVYPQSRV